MTQQTTGHEINLIDVYGTNTWSPWCVTCMCWLTGSDSGVTYADATRETMAHILSTIPKGMGNRRSVKVAYSLGLGPEDMVWAGTYADAGHLLLDESLAYLYRIVLEMVDEDRVSDDSPDMEYLMYLFQIVLELTTEELEKEEPKAKHRYENIRALVGTGEWDIGIIKAAIHEMLS